MTKVIDMAETEVLDVEAAKAVLVEWLAAWLTRDWRRMAANTAPVTQTVDGQVLASNFSHREITQYTDPQFKDGNTSSLSGQERVSFADFSVSVACDGRGDESFVARVIGIGDKWGVNAISTMKRTTSPSGKGQQWQRRPKAKSSMS